MAPGRGRRDPEQMRQMMLEGIKQALKATDEDWEVLQPRIEKVQTLSRQTRGMGGMGAFFGRRRMPGGGPGGPGGMPGGRRGGAESARELTEVEKQIQELATVLENEEADPEEIKEKLTALREARENAKQELAKAQDELREVVTLRQEAQLVLMGMLD